MRPACPFPVLLLLRVGVTGKRLVDWPGHSSEKAARGMKSSSSLSSLCSRRDDTDNYGTMVATEMTPRTRNSSQVRIVDVDFPPPKGKASII